MTFVVGSGAGFSGDRVDGAIPVVRELVRRGLPSALMFETLGERTLAEAQLTRRCDPARGYEPLLEEFLPPVLDTCLEHGITVLGNFGAANLQGACQRIMDIAACGKHYDASIAVVRGDDVRARLYELELEAWEAETNDLPSLDNLIAANVYLGARPLVHALERNAQVVVTGRVADPALALAPLVKHFNWAWDDWPRIAAGTLAGHLIECGTQVTGGYFADPGYKDVHEPALLGYPLAEVDQDGRIVITKPRDTGGQVTEQTVKEQLLYEVHDPSSYITPDVIVDLSSVHVRQIGRDRVEVVGVRGRPAPEKLKTTVCYAGGWLGEAEISYAGPHALERLKLAINILQQRLRDHVPDSLRRRFDAIGYMSVFDDDSAQLRKTDQQLDPRLGSEDVRLRLSVEHDERALVERATQELLALYCCGPAGGGAGWRHHRRRMKTASFLVPKKDVSPQVEFYKGTVRETDFA